MASLCLFRLTRCLSIFLPRSFADLIVVGVQQFTFRPASTSAERPQSPLVAPHCFPHPRMADERGASEGGAFL